MSLRALCVYRELRNRSSSVEQVATTRRLWMAPFCAWTSFITGALYTRKSVTRMRGCFTSRARLGQSATLQLKSRTTTSALPNRSIWAWPSRQASHFGKWWSTASGSSKRLFACRPRSDAVYVYILNRVISLINDRTPLTMAALDKT